MKNVKEFVKAIREERRGFAFGEPWRFDESSLTAILPILRKSKAKRTYLVLGEAKKVKMEDTGDISSVLVTNNEKKPVFIRAGNIFKGKTQERAATISRIVMPGKTEKIDVVCIHQSQPITSGARVESAGVAPSSINLSSQSDAWQSAAFFNASAVSTVANLRSTGSSNALDIDQTDATVELNFAKADDIASNLKSFSKAIESVLKKVPFTKNQVGVVLLDTKGCAGLEAFNLTGSWKAIKDDIVRREGEKIAEVDKDNVFEYKPEKAKKQAKKALENEFEEADLYKDKESQTVKISYGDFVGEVALLRDRVIHLSLTKNEAKS